MKKIQAFLKYLQRPCTKIKLNIFILLIFAFCASFVNTKKVQAQEEAKATVKVIYEGSGSVLLGKYDKDNDGRNYFESGLLEYTFNIGEYAIVNAKCEDDVEFLGWYVNKGDYIDLKTEAKTTYFKVTSDITYYAYFKGNDEVSITYVNSSVLKDIFAIEIVKKGEDAKGITAPKKTGFDFKSWSESIEKLDKDIMVYPTYKYNIFTVFRDYYQFFLSQSVELLAV